MKKVKRILSLLLAFMLTIQPCFTNKVFAAEIEDGNEITDGSSDNTSEELFSVSTQTDAVEISEESTEQSVEIIEVEDIISDTEEISEDIIEESTSEADKDESETIQIDASELQYRLLVLSDNEEVLTDGFIISSYEGVHIIGYASEDERTSGYQYYQTNGVFVEYDDEIFEIADNEMIDDTDEHETIVINSDDALTVLSEMETSEISSSDVIAVIDTGDNGMAMEAVSVIGEDAKDGNGHGSMVINTILEENPDARILSIKAFGSDGRAKPSDIYAAVRYAIDNHVSIINMSFAAFSTADNTIVKDIIDEAISSGITVVGASGNNGKELKYFIPGSIDNAIIIGAVDNDKNFLKTNNYGPSLDYLTYGSSSSEATARFTGILLKAGIEGIENSDRVFRHEYKEIIEDIAETPTESEEYGDIEWFDQDSDFRTASVTIGGTVYPSRITLKNVRITGADYSIIYNRAPWTDPTTGETYIRGTALDWTFSGDSSCPRGWFASGGGTDDSIDEDKYQISKMLGFCTYAGRVEPTGFTRDVQLRIVTSDQTDYDPSDAGHARYIASGVRMIDSDTYQTVGVQVKLVPPSPQESDFYIGLQKKSATNFNPSMDDTVYHITDATPNHNIFYELTLGSTGKIKSAKAYKNGGIDRSTVTVSGTDKLIFMGVEVYNGNNYIHIHRTNTGGLSSNMLMLHEASSNKYYKLNTTYDMIPATGNGNHVLLTANECPSLSEGPVPETPKGAIQVFKTDEKNNPLSGVVFTVYSDQACTKKVDEITTASTGLGGCLLPAGTYYVKETKGKAGYKPDTSKEPYKCIVDVSRTFAAGGQNYGPVFNADEYISTQYNPQQDLRKAFGTDKDKLTGHFSNYGMREGRRASVNFDLATYRSNYVRNGVMDGDQAFKNWTNEDFYNHFANYGIKEGRLARPVSEFKSMQKGVNQNSSVVVVVRAVNTKSSAYVTVTKSGSDSGCTKNNPNYSLKGTEIGLYETKADALNNKKCIHTFVMDESGNTTAFMIPDSKLTYDALGNIAPKTFWLKETKAGKGYQLNDEPMDVKVTSANTASNPAKANIVNTPSLDPVDIYIIKNDIDGTSVSDGTGSLEGAQFTIKYYAVDTTKTYTASQLASLKADATWTIQTKYDSKIKKYRAHLNTEWLVGNGNSNFYYEGNGTDPMLPLGYITIQETKAPKGYTVVGSTFKWSDGSTTKDTVVVAKTNDSKTLFVGNKTVTGNIEVNEIPIRGNFALKKVDENDKPMKDVEFKITNTSTKESYTFMTDKNGEYNSTSADLWFSKKSDGSVTKKISGLGALPTGTYIVEEQRCEANKDKQLEPPITFTVTSTTTYNLSSTDKDSVITNVDMPVIGTTASVVSTSSKLVPQNSDVTITDVVTYSHLKADTDYILAGRLMVVEKDGTYKPYQKDGKDYVVTKSFRTPASYTKSVYNVSGSTTVTFNINSKGLEDKTLTVFEKLYLGKTVPSKDSDASQYSDNPGIFPVSHEDKTDLAQTVYVPDLATAASSEGEKLLLPDENAVVVDKVSYSNLLKGEKFVVKGRLIDKATGKTVVDAKGKEVTAEKEFTASGASGKVEMTYKFDASNMSGRTLVCYEYIYYKNVLVMQHADINDKAQTVYFPSGKTTATDNKTETHMTLAGKEASITDVLEYSNLIAGKKYKAIGRLIDKTTGKTVISGGKEVISETEFTPAASEGSVDIHFTFDASMLEGTTLVVFEDVTYDNKSVIIHHDLDDENQTIYIPKGRTSAKDDKTEDHITFAEEEAHITDTLTYSNLVKGLTYTVCGRLYDKNTGKPIKDAEGNDIISMVRFKAEKADGQIEVPFTFDASILKNTKVVVAEDVLYNSHKIITHFDLTDTEQTIWIPDGHTTALDNKTDDHMVLAEEEAEITDIITYEGLISGRTYKAVGKLYDKNTAEAIKDEKGNEIVSTVEFYAETENGEVKVPFKFNAAMLKTNEIVVFEDVYLNDRLVFSHNDLNDSEQTLTIPDGHTTALDKKTEQHITLAEKNAEITDELSYSGLIKNKEYTSVGTMYDKNTGEPVKDAEGNIITSTVKFTAENESGVIEIPFKFDAGVLAGHKIVIFEDVFYNGREVIIHHDINDTEQTIWIPEGSTTAKDSKTLDHIMLAEEEAEIIDTISYKGLPAGQNYTATGMLIDRNTGLPIMDKDGNKITASADFIPETEDGTVDVTYRFDASLLAGTTIVIYEDIYSEGKAVIVHHSLDDENQTIYIPSGHTEARDGKTEMATGIADTEAEIIDRVYFDNLIIDKTYECTGTLYEKETGEPVKDVEGKIITNTVSFRPMSTSGYVEVPFKYDASLLKGKTVVSFEDVTYEGNTVLIHHDITDEKQSVNYPSVRTTATLKNGGKKVQAGSDVTVIDEVQYSNVRIGDRFKVKGYMVNKTTGEKFVINGKPVEADKEFTAEAADGMIEMQFGFNTTGIDKLDLVVYEELYLIKQAEGENIEIMVASHADINDTNQTVSIITVPKTGDSIPIIPLAGAGIASVAGTLYVVKKKKEDAE